MDIFNIENIVSIVIKNKGRMNLSICNRLLEPNQEIDILKLGFNVESFKEFLNNNPGLVRIFSDEKFEIKLEPVLTSNTNSDEIKIESNKVEEIEHIIVETEIPEEIDNKVEIIQDPFSEESNKKKKKKKD